MAFNGATGFECQSVTSDVELPSILGSPTISTSVKRSGAASLKISSLTSGARMGFRPIHASAGTGPFYYQRCLCLETLPSAANRIFLINNSGDESSPLVWYALENNGTLTFHDEDGQIGSASSALTVDGATFYYLEVKVDLTGGAGAHVLEMKINGTAFASASNRSLSANPASSSLGGNLAFEAQTTGVWYWDDVIDNDDVGSDMIGYQGGKKIIHQNPAGNAATFNWSGSYTDIDEITPDDATTYVSEGPSADTFEVTLTAAPAEIGASDTINSVWPGHRATLDDATGSDPRYAVRLTLGGVTDETSVFLPNTTSWYTNGLTSRAYPTLANSSNYQKPGGSSAYAKSDLSNIQIGARISTTDTHNVRITTMWLMVIFTAVAGGTTYNQSVSGASTPTGTVSKSTSKSPSGAVSSIVGTVAKQTAKTLSGAISSIVGTLTTSRGYTRSFSGSITPAGALSNQVNKAVSGAVSSITGGLARSVNKSLVGSISSIVGTLTRQTSKSPSGAVTSEGALSTVKTFLVSLSGAIAPAGALVKSVAKSVSGAITPSGTLSKIAAKLFTGTASSTGTVTKQTNKSSSGSVASSGAIIKQIGKSLSGTVASSGVIVRSISKFVSGAISSITGALQTASAAIQSLFGVVATITGVARPSASIDDNLPTATITPVDLPEGD